MAWIHSSARIFVRSQPSESAFSQPMEAALAKPRSACVKCEKDKEWHMLCERETLHSYVLLDLLQHLQALGVDVSLNLSVLLQDALEIGPEVCTVVHK